MYMVSPRELVRGISQKYPFQVARSNDSGSFGAPRTLIHNCWPLIITSSAVPSFASLRSSPPTPGDAGAAGVPTNSLPQSRSSFQEDARGGLDIGAGMRDPASAATPRFKRLSL